MSSLAAAQKSVDRRLERLAAAAQEWVLSLSWGELVAAVGCECDAVRMLWRVYRRELEAWDLLGDEDVMVKEWVRWSEAERLAAAACRFADHQGGGNWVLVSERGGRGVVLGDRDSVLEIRAVGAAVERDVELAAGKREPLNWADVMTRVPSEIVEEDCGVCGESPRVRFL